jgi:hypothetical protein
VPALHSVNFEKYDEKNKMISLCMSAHSAYLLQPLDIGRFGPLKKAYGREIEHLIRSISNGVSTTGKGILVSVTATTDACYSIKLYQWGGVAGMQR